MRAIVAVLLFVSAAHAALWGVLQEKQPAPDFRGILPSVSYAPFERGHTVVDIAADSEKVRDRPEEALDPDAGGPPVFLDRRQPNWCRRIAAEFGMKVTVGAWIDTNANRNDREIKEAIRLARGNSNVIGIVVGNETIYRGEQIPLENLWVLPATTGRSGIEASGFAASSANRSAARITREIAARRGCQSAAGGQARRSDEMGDCRKQRLPADQGDPARQEVRQRSRHDRRNLEHLARPSAARLRLSISSPRTCCPTGKTSPTSRRSTRPSISTGLLRDKFPGKRIVIAEFGWPSAGYNLVNADPGPFQQASVLRNFVARAEAMGMEYNIVEAIDQPWKYFEGGVGPYWGVLNAAREPKFSWTGPIVNPDYWKLATIALLVGILMSLPILRAGGADGAAGAAAVGGRQRRRRLGRDRLRLLGRPLLHVRLGFRPDARA